MNKFKYGGGGGTERCLPFPNFHQQDDGQHLENSFFQEVQLFVITLVSVHLLQFMEFGSRLSGKQCKESNDIYLLAVRSVVNCAPDLANMEAKLPHLHHKGLKHTS